MSLGFDLKLVQEQKLVMTMEMQQSIRLLQMSSYDLLQYIDKESEENVVISVSRHDDYSYSFHETWNVRDNYFQGNDEKKVSPFEFVANKITLREYMYDQLIDLNIDFQMKNIAVYIIDSIDGSGYLDEHIIEDIALKYNVSSNMGEKVLKMIQEFDPPGIGARTLGECLRLQLKRKEFRDELVWEIIDKYLVELSDGAYRNIAKKLNVSPGKVQEAEQIIRKLNPKPARGFFCGEDTNYLIPDVKVISINNNMVVIPNDEILPEIYIDKEYENVLNSGDTEAEKFLKERIESATALIKAITLRKNTVCRVAEEIVRLQQGYIEGILDNPRPMTIKEIAVSLGFHESTVSRAVKDKYISLPSGRIKSMRSFFSTAVNNNEDISSQVIKNRIKKIIEEEDDGKPYSDSAIEKLLLKENIIVSRRTIAKYREELGIKSSSRRRRME